jgi:hypothetical protein
MAHTMPHPLKRSRRSLFRFFKSKGHGFSHANKTRVADASALPQAGVKRGARND